MPENGNALAPYQVNCTFRGNDIGKVVVMNAANPANEAVAGDTVQINQAEQNQDVRQKNDQKLKGKIEQETGDTYSIAIEGGPGDAVAVASSEHNLDQDAKLNQKQKATNKNTQKSKQKNQAE
jgi:hypothetical protein